jgi:hypothetical protein
MEQLRGLRVGGYNPMCDISHKQAQERLGEISTNCQSEPMKIIAYRTATDIDIQFLETKNVVYHQTYSNFQKGAIKDYFLPTFYGVGILGDSEILDENGKRTLAFNLWEFMLQRCYYDADLQRYPTYQPCSVCDDWLHLSNFEEWIETNYYQCGDEKMCLDKDILYKNNKIYSPETTIIVPERINILFTKTNANRGQYPIGVYYKKKNQKFVAQVSRLKDEKSHTKQQEHLGLYDTTEEAFQAYKIAKESYIKEVADFYMNKYSNFPQKLYDALYAYQVEITD